MTRCPPRLTGVLLLVASGATTAVHRAVWESVRYGPPQVVEMALGLSTFTLASVGVLLLIHGGKLFRRSPDEVPFRTASRFTSLTRIVDPVRPGGRACDTRRGVAAMQARAALTAAGVTRRSTRGVTDAPRHFAGE